MSPRISVIVPVYNSEEYLKDCLFSVLHQTLTDIEIIVIDNGSTDGSSAHLGQLAANHGRIKVITLAKNQGVSIARNVGLDHAEGEYVAFCDSDDSVPPGAYKSMYTEAVRSKADIVVGNYKETSEEHSIFVSDIPLSRKVTFFSYMHSGAVWNHLFRRSFLKRNRILFSPNYSHGEDTLFLAQAYSAKPHLAGTHRAVYQYMIREQSSTQSLARERSVENLLEYLNVERKIISLLVDAVPPEVLTEYMNVKIVFLLRYWWHIPTLDDKSKGFLLLQKFLTDYHQYLTDEQFQQLFFLSQDEFSKISFEKFLLQFDLLDPKGQVLRQFKNGQIGFRYIVLYVAGWLAHKVGNHKKQES